MKPAGKVAVLAASTVCLFAACVGILFQILPGPRTSVDYLVIGGIATFASLLVVFFVLITTITRTSDTFYKRRVRTGASESIAVPPGDTRPSSDPASQS